jgi:pimeloyl-ACP methyl ester carboxylesterase
MFGGRGSENGRAPARRRGLFAQREPDPGGRLPEGIPGRFIPVNGHLCHVVEQGAGDAVILVHGTAGTTLDWEATAQSLSESYRVVALDLFGMGFSDRIEKCSYGF